MVCLGLKIPTIFSDKATIFDENPPARNPTKKLLCCYDHQEIRVRSPSCATYHIHSQPCKHQRTFGELEGFPAYLYRFCIPGAVGHWHRGIAGHGHGTDGGSTRHHIWRWGVNHLRSTSVNHVTNSHQLDCYTTWDNQQILELVYTTWEFNGFFP